MAQRRRLAFLRSGKGIALVALGLLVVLAVAAWLTLQWFISSAHLSRKVEEGLVAALGGAARVGAVEVDLLSGVTIRDVEVRGEGEEAPWASAAAIEVDHRPAALLRGALDVVAVRVVAPSLVINDRTLERLRRLSEEPAGEGPSPAAISIEQGRVRIEPNADLPGVEETDLRSIALSVSNPDRHGRLLQIQGRARTPAGRVRLDALVDSAARSVSFDLASSDIALDKVPRGMLPEPVRQRREVRELTGHVAVEARGRYAWATDEEELAYTARLGLHRVAFATDHAPYPLRGIAGEVRVRPGSVTAADLTGRLGAARFRLDEAQVLLDPAGAMEEVYARGEVFGMRLDDPLRNFLPKDARDALEQAGLQEAGGDVQFRLAQVGEEPPDIVAELAARDVTLRPKGFPYPLPALAGRVRYDSASGLITAHDVEGTGAFSIEGDAMVTLGKEKADYRARAAVDGLELDEPLRNALPKDVVATWEDLGIRGGAVDADVRVSGNGQGAPRVTAGLELHSVLARPKAFPYPLPPLSGSLRYDAEQVVHIAELAGARGRLKLRVTGRVETAGKRPAVQLLVSGTRLPVDAALREALPEDVRKAIERAGLSGGALDVDVALQAAEGEPDVVADVALRSCSLRFADAPYALDDVTGKLHWTSHNQTLELDGITAVHGTTRIAVDGQVDLRDPDRARPQLMVQAQALDLGQEFQEALPEDVRKKIKPYAPSGDVDARLAYDDLAAEGGPRVRLSTVLHGVGLRPAAEVPRLTDLRGELRSDGQALNLVGVSGRVASLPIEMGGSLALRPEAGETELVLRLPAFRLTPKLVRRFPETTAEKLKTLGASGILDGAATLTMPKGAASPYLSSATVRLEDVAVSLPPAIDRVNGSATYTAPARILADAPAQVGLNLLRARVAGLAVQDASARVLLTPEAVEFKEVNWSLYGGRAGGSLRLSREEPVRYTGQLDLAHLDVESFAMALGRTKDAPTGWLRGTIQFQGTGTGLAGLELTGECKVDRGHIYDLPIFATVLNVLSLRLPGRDTITSAHLEFEVKEHMLRIIHLLVKGRSTPVHVTGTIGLAPGKPFDQQPVDLVFTVPRETRLLDQIPVVSWLKQQSVDRLQRHFLQARVTGTLAEPQVQHLLRPLLQPIEGFWSVLQRLSTPSKQEAEKPTQP